MENRSQRPIPPLSKRSNDEPTKQFFAQATGKRVATDVIIAKAIQQQYPKLKLSIVEAYNCDLHDFAASGHASLTVLDDADDGIPSSLEWKAYLPPARRMDGHVGDLVELPKFGKYLYTWNEEDYIVYLVDGRDGVESYPQVANYYILSTDEELAEELLLAVGKWGSDLHDEIWVFDGGFWQKNFELYESARNSSWDAVILDKEMKDAIIEDHLSFFRSRDTYAGLKVPWKRGIIYYGPPGNGKTISIKATMNMLYSMNPPIPTLYVRSLTSFSGPEASINQVFSKAREFAPCYLVFEDLDTIVTDEVRSYFLNEMDGLKSNDGIFVVGSTNYLDQLDPGISKRPSRFDRKYLFPDPNLSQRVAYGHFWQGKLASNKNIEFPDKLCDAIAEITDGFSFAYMQEAFVAALLAIARNEKPAGAQGDARVLTRDLGDDEWVQVLGKAIEGDADLQKLVLWVEIKKQIAILREGMEEKKI
ncbi:putative ATPase YjoB [Cladobotryum mycophilum]|uniref:ATPase YjoB n=1 Tax=Cladobotryum mycophilum TaxID=491253 RepID=A0ABR0SSL9_9HYPO